MRWLFLLALALVLAGCLQPSQPAGESVEGDFAIESGCVEGTLCGSEPTFSVAFYPSGTTKANVTCDMRVNASANSTKPWYDYGVIKSLDNQTWNMSIFLLNNSDTIANKSNVTMKFNNTIGNYTVCIADLNKLLNSNAENGDGGVITNWTKSVGQTNGTAIQNRTESHHGNASFELSNSTNYTFGAGLTWTSVPISVQGDNRNLTNTSNWSLQGWMKISATAGTGVNYVSIYVTSLASNGTSCGNVSATNRSGATQFYTTSGWSYLNITNMTVLHSGDCAVGGSNTTNISVVFNMGNMTGYAWFDDFYLYQEYPARFNATTLPSPCTNLTTTYQNITVLNGGVYGNDTVRLSGFVNCSETRPLNASTRFKYKFNMTQG